MLGERIVREFGVNMYTLLYFKWITNKFHIAHGTLLNVMWHWIGREVWGRMDGYMYMLWLSPCTVHLKLSQYC